MNSNALAPLADNAPSYPPEQNSRTSIAVQQFADDNRYAFELRKAELVQYSWRDYQTLPAWLGMVGLTATKDAYYVTSGEFMNYPFTMFLMWDNLTNGRQFDRPDKQQLELYTQQQTTGIVRITLPKLFPQIVLDSNINDNVQSSIRTEYKPAQRLNLEGDFAKYFDLYVPAGIQINALSLLAPNMMQILINNSGLFDIEFNGYELILMTRQPLYDPEVMKLLDEAMTEQLTYMDRLLQSWNYTPNEQPTDMLIKPYIGGSVIKIGNYRFGAKFQLITIASLFLLYGIVLLLTKN